MSSISLLVNLLFSSLLSYGIVGINGQTTDAMLVDHDTIVKTIMTRDGEIDCVDIYRQPAFKHPNLRNHSLQMRPSSYPIGIEPTSHFNSGKFENQNGDGEDADDKHCPKGTIPILKSLDYEHYLPKNWMHHRRPASRTDGLTHHFTPESAVALQPGGNYHGAEGDMSIWAPRVLASEYSASQIWLTADGGDGKDIESIEAGWMVTPWSPDPKLFIYWTADNRKTSGCYNLWCAGFVQVNQKVVLNGAILPVSKIGDTTLVNILIHQDNKTGNWWFRYEGTDVGYWPADLFTGFKKAAGLIEWGGKVMNSNLGGIHTATQMGNGLLPSDPAQNAAWFRRLGFVDDQNVIHDPDRKLIGLATKPNCYDIEVRKWDEHSRVHFFYGGPGYSINCM